MCRVEVSEDGADGGVKFGFGGEDGFFASEGVDAEAEVLRLGDVHEIDSLPLELELILLAYPSRFAGGGLN